VVGFNPRSPVRERRRESAILIPVGKEQTSARTYEISLLDRGNCEFL
jgi:hypothetical protein